MFGTTVAESVEQLRPRALASTVGVWRVSAGGGSAVLKLLRRGATANPRWPSEPGVSDPYHWRREPLAYASDIPAVFGAPRCLGQIERADGSVALWLEDGGRAPEWTAHLLGGVGRRLGRVQAAFAASLPEDDWLSRDWLRAYLAAHGVDAGAAVLEQLDRAPQTVCHHDLHPANLLGPHGEVVIDWAYCGIAALGLDAGVLVADGIADEAFPAADADAVAAAVWAGYTDGLGGAYDLGDVRFAFARGTALRLSWLPRGDRPAWDATIDFLERLASDV